MRVKFATDCKLTVYANDMPLYMPIYMDKIEDYAILQESINMLNSWALDSHLKLNPLQMQIHFFYNFANTNSKMLIHVWTLISDTYLHFMIYVVIRAT